MLIPHGSGAGSGDAFRRRMGPLIEVSGYDLPNGFRGSPEMISNRRLAQNEKRKSKDDACRDDGAELGKYRPDAARSKFRRLGPCSPTKIVHVGLHVATSCWAHRPATAGARASRW
jgi:hypothetical protein